MHEAQLHDDNCFITLTYDEQRLPWGGTLVLGHFQKFMKRLRKRHGAGIRFFHCGEYGGSTGRPHYHALLFGLDFDDKEWLKDNDQGDPLFTSSNLSSLWPYGHASVGALSAQSAAYVTRYALKKVTGHNAEAHYETMHESTGEIFQKRPEYVTMSRRPGIGARWLERFGDEVFPDDFVVVNGKERKVPKSYDKLLEKADPRLFARVKSERRRTGMAYSAERTPERLRVRERVCEARVGQLKRNLE